jgi:hypothetical protein
MAATAMMISRSVACMGEMPFFDFIILIAVLVNLFVNVGYFSYLISMKRKYGLRLNSSSKQFTKKPNQLLKRRLHTEYKKKG